ncbi:MAG: hypothetical protein U1D30_18865 [Planctomycetota bacterium]
MFVLEDYMALAVSRLPIGQKVRHPVLDRDHHVLVEGDRSIEAELVGRLQYHGIRPYVHREDREAWGLGAVGGPLLPPTLSESEPQWTSFNPKESPTMVPGLLQFVQERVASLAATGGEDPKSGTRYCLALAVRMQNLDKCYRPMDETFAGVLRDLTPNLLGAVSARAPRSEQVVVELRLPHKDPFQLVCRVQRCEPSGRYYDMTCRIVARLSPADSVTEDLRSHGKATDSIA